MRFLDSMLLLTEVFFHDASAFLVLNLNRQVRCPRSGRGQFQLLVIKLVILVASDRA